MSRTPIPPPGKAARNERRKALAAFLNGMAGACVIIGVIQPLFGDAVGAFDWRKAAASLILMVVLHALARGELRQLED